MGAHLPVGRRVKLAEVGLELAGEDLESGGLADAVGADEPEDLASTRHRQPAWRHARMLDAAACAATRETVTTARV